MSARNGATSRVIGATSRVIDAMSASSGGMSERGDATSELSAAMARLSGAMGRCGPSIATNGVATRGPVLSIERQARAIANEALAIERVEQAQELYLTVNEVLEYEKLTHYPPDDSQVARATPSPFDNARRFLGNCSRSHILTSPVFELRLLLLDQT
jgi:hypothetical protein